ncbi:TPA: GNAT family N-acetyltransferase [Photobacterium damselae]
MKIELEIVKKIDINDEHRRVFAEILGKQGKVQGNLATKADRCHLIAIAKMDNKPVAIGAIKQKTVSDFSPAKADLEELNSQFSWEIGYLYTDPDYRGNGLAKRIVVSLLDIYGDDNLMASTELEENPQMVSILEQNGFSVHGKSWASVIHGNKLGLFLKFKK